MDRSRIVVFIDNELIGAGTIKELTTDSVKIETKRFIRRIVRLNMWLRLK
ncbi:hypothetical protein [Paenibacillus terrae]|nr:hypothetical protein [Paenibacillus terrae]